MILGIDTSNYTTSAAVLDGEALTQQKQLLEVRPGERGLRQSDALFQHTRNLPLLFDKLPPMDGVTAVGVSTRPRNVEAAICLAFWQGSARRLLPLRLPVALFIPPLTKWGTFWRHCTEPVRWR